MKEMIMTLANGGMWLYSIIIIIAFGGAISEDGFIKVTNRVLSSEGGILIIVWAIISLWWILRYFFKGTPKTVVIQTTSLTLFVFKNIILPIILSYIIMEVTGSPSITLVSVPIIGVISANIGIG